MDLVVGAQLLLEPETSCVLFLSQQVWGSHGLSALRHLCSKALVCFCHASKTFHALLTLKVSL